MIERGGPISRAAPFLVWIEGKHMRVMYFLALSAIVLNWPVNGAKAEQSQDANIASPPVYAGDVQRSYRVIGEIRDNLRKHFAFQASPTEEKIYSEIWERARKLGADAVINARYGETERTMFNHGRTPISGTAIKYTEAGDDESSRRKAK